MSKFTSLALLLLVSSFLIKAQNSLHFDGQDDRLNCGNSSSVQLSGSAITLEAWIFPTAWTAQVWQGNIINKENNSPDYGYMLRCGDNGKLNFNLGNGSWHELTTAANTLSLNVWQHVAGTYDGSKIRIYVNGQLVDSSNVAVNFSSGLQNLTVGNWSNTPDRAFVGRIDEVRVWNVVRSRAELNAGMQAEYCTAPAGCVAYYQLNEGLPGQNNTGLTTAPDLSLNGNNGTLSNFALNGNASNWSLGATINPASDFVQIVDSTCSDYLGPNGQIYDSTGVYLDTLQNSEGCDSIIETNLTVNSVNNGVTANSNILVAQQAGALYQWLDCSAGMQMVNGANGQLLTPPNPQSAYAVIVNYRGCIDTSACYSLRGIGLDENASMALSIYPNPASSSFHISHPQMAKGQLYLFDALGRCIIEAQKVYGTETEVKAAHLPAGTYYLRLSDADQVMQEILIIE